MSEDQGSSGEGRAPEDPEIGEALGEQAQPAPARRRSRRRRQTGAAPPPTAEPPSPPDEGVLAADEYADGSAFYRFSAFLGLAAAAVFAFAVVTYNTVGTFSKEVLALLIVAVVLAVLYAIPRLEELTNWLRTRSARQGSNVTLASVAVLGLLVVGNWYVNRHSPQWDLTNAKRYTLSDQSVKVLDKLDKDVKVVAFLSGRQDDTFSRGTRDLLQLYARKSKHVQLQFVDPEVSPGVAQQYGITSFPVTIFQAGDRQEQTTGLTEQDFTSTLLKLEQTQQKKVYFLQGHQERDPGSSAQNGYSSAQDALQKENYQVATLSLLSTQKVPDDAAVLVIAGPRAPLLDPEQQAIDDYLAGGGHVLMLIEPRQDAGLGPILDKWYVQLDEDIAIDPGRNLAGDALSPAPLLQSGHRISAPRNTSGVASNLIPDVIMPGARSMKIKSGAGSDFAIAPLLKTTDRAWGETNFTAQPAFDPGQDVPGPLTLGVAVNKTEPVPAVTPGATPTPTAQSTPPAPKGRLVVVGDAEFASNTYFSQVLGNRDFFVNSVDWLAEDENLISIRADPQGGNAPIVLTNQAQVLVFYTSVVFIPLVVLLLGGVVWWQRR